MHPAKASASVTAAAASFLAPSPEPPALPTELELLLQRGAGLLRSVEGSHPVATLPPADQARLLSDIRLTQDTPLGSGTFGHVYAAELSGQPCAVKVLAVCLLVTTTVEGLIGELRSISIPQHPNLALPSAVALLDGSDPAMEQFQGLCKAGAMQTEDPCFEALLVYPDLMDGNVMELMNSHLVSEHEHGRAHRDRHGLAGDRHGLAGVRGCLPHQ